MAKGLRDDACKVPRAAARSAFEGVSPGARACTSGDEAGACSIGRGTIVSILRSGRTWIFACLLMTASVARAHEARPAYLEIKETAPGQYSILWRTPVLAAARLPHA